MEQQSMAGLLQFGDGSHTWKARVEQKSLFPLLPTHIKTIKSRGIVRVCCGCGKRDVLHYLPEPFEAGYFACRSCNQREKHWRENSRYYWLNAGGLMNVNYYGKEVEL